MNMLIKFSISLIKQKLTDSMIFLKQFLMEATVAIIFTVC